MQILPLSQAHIPEAAAFFIQNYHKQRQSTPLLPAAMEDKQRVEQMLKASFDASSALVAIEHGNVVGYLGWYLVDHFRGSKRKGAYIPEWGHAAAEGDKGKIYQAIYRCAAERWAEAGCQVHAITLLAEDQAAEKAWFWNGFGLTVIDAIRPMQPLERVRETGVTIRKATSADAAALSQLDAEHWQHYVRSPVFMPFRSGKDADQNIASFARSNNSVWLAEDGGELAGFLRFDGYDFDSVAILESEDGIIITGAYVRPAYRGRKVAVALLDAALRDYQSRGYKYCAVTFEFFNPEAASFWPCYFEPVCLSALRVPENTQD